MLISELYRILEPTCNSNQGFRPNWVTPKTPPKLNADTRTVTRDPVLTNDSSVGSTAHNSTRNRLARDHIAEANITPSAPRSSNAFAEPITTSRPETQALRRQNGGDQRAATQDHPLQSALPPLRCIAWFHRFCPRHVVPLTEGSILSQSRCLLQFERIDRA